MGDYRDDIPWSLKVPFWLVGMLFWGGAIFAGYRMRVIVGMAMVLASMFMLWSVY